MTIIWLTQYDKMNWTSRIGRVKYDKKTTRDSLIDDLLIFKYLTMGNCDRIDPEHELTE